MTLWPMTLWPMALSWRKFPYPRPALNFEFVSQGSPCSSKAYTKREILRAPAIRIGGLGLLRPVLLVIGDKDTTAFGRAGAPPAVRATLLGRERRAAYHPFVWSNPPISDIRRRFRRPRPSIRCCSTGCVRTRQIRPDHPPLAPYRSSGTRNTVRSDCHCIHCFGRGFGRIAEPDHQTFIRLIGSTVGRLDAARTRSCSAGGPRAAERAAAGRLGISEVTLQIHCSDVMQKIKVASLADVVRMVAIDIN
jgi:hypothetical protein